MFYSNIFYFKRISKIGGTEQFLYEIAKKYHDYDITVFYDEANSYQLERLIKYIKCKKHIKGEKIKCDKAFFNFNLDMINDVEANEYYFVSHAIYQEIGYKPPIENPKLTHYIGVSQYSCDKLIEYSNRLGKEIKVIRCYNPLTLEPKEKVIHIVSAGRLDDKTKDNGRTVKLIKALDKYAIENNRHYIWTIFSNPISFDIDSPNVVLMKPRVDVRPYIADADFVVQLSNDMETYCYTNQEALGYGVRIITTPLTVNKELQVPQEANLICEWNMSNVDEIAKKVFEEEYKEFKYKAPQDSWLNILNKTKTNYKEEDMKVKIKCTYSYTDVELKRDIPLGYEWIVDKKRADELLANPHHLVEIVEYITEEKPKEKAIKPKKNVETRTVTIKGMKSLASDNINTTITKNNDVPSIYTKE